MTSQDLHGLLVIDKPAGMTSRAVVNRAQQWFPRGTRLGHTGTLDPLATGVLVLCAGVATRLTEFVQDMSKTYRAGLLLGMRSDTDDADGVLTPVDGAPIPGLATVTDCLRDFVGNIEQVPPAYSAAKVTGRRAYDLSRRGQSVVLQSRPVTIDKIEVMAFAYPHLDIEVHCGKGTYIRSLARDLGDKLGCGAIVQALRRTRVGPFIAEEAMSLDTTAEVARTRLLPLSVAVADLPVVELAPERLRQLTMGQVVPFNGMTLMDDRLTAVFAADGRLHAIARWHPDQGRLQPVKVLFDVQ